MPDNALNGEILRIAKFLVLILREIARAGPLLEAGGENDKRQARSTGSYRIL